MRKAIAIVCLVSFFALQYGKLVSYWHCKISAAVSATRCDCEKTVADIHTEGTHQDNSTVIASQKYEETYLFHELAVLPPQLPVVNNNNIPVYVAVIPQNHTRSIFQPPRV